jgi:hypothetical protein
LLRCIEFVPDTRSRLAVVVATELRIVAGEKKCCEAGGALLIEDAPGVLFVELKLSRDGFTGNLPVIMLDCLNDASLRPA